MQLPEQTAMNQRNVRFWLTFCVCTRPKATLAELLYLMLSRSFCFSFSAPCKHWCNNAFHYMEERRWVSLVALLHLNNRSTAVFKKLITFLAVAKVSRSTLRCNIGSSDQQQISAGMRKSCLWWVQHVNDLCVFIGHGAGPASLQDSDVGTTLWQRLATADGNKQQRGGLTLLQHFTVCSLLQQNVSLSFSSYSISLILKNFFVRFSTLILYSGDIFNKKFTFLWGLANVACLVSSKVEKWALNLCFNIFSTILGATLLY